MFISYDWLQDYFDAKLPEPEKLAEGLTTHSFQVEGIEEKDGDFVFDIDVLPNRASDCLSHIGVAREISAVFELPLKENYRTGVEAPVSKILKIEIEDEKDCPRYIGLVIKGVKNRESPEWLKKRLVSINQRPINAVVDAANYAMFETGQPLHAFDWNKLEDKDGKRGLAIRRAKKGEKITLLTGENLELGEENLVIADLNSDLGEVLGIAGIKGGKRAEIDSDTIDILLEAAKFHPVLTRKSAKALKIQTDASKRFENEIAPEMAAVAMKRLSELILEIAGGEVEGAVDVFTKPGHQYKIGVSISEINEVLGTSLSEKEVDKILKRLQFSYKRVKPLETILREAGEVLGASYKFGASVLNDSPKFFDCSSLTSYLFIQAGVFTPRMSVDQFLYGEPVEKEKAKPGDLVFVNRNEGKEHRLGVEFMNGKNVPEGVSHLGMYLGDGKVLHASGKQGKVVIENLKGGVFENAVGWRRILNDDSERYVVEIPFERIDLMVKEGLGARESLIEEIGRIYGYENIDAKLPGKTGKKQEANKTFYCANKVRKVLAGLGFSEIQTSSFRKEGEIAILNPLAEDKAFLRRNLSSNMEDALARNDYNKELLGLESIKTFEIGKVFDEDGEELRLSIYSGNPEDSEDSAEVLSKALSAEVSFEKDGEIGEINLGDLIEKLPEPKEYEIDFDYAQKRFENFSPYPFVLRDIAAFMPEGKDEKDLLKLAEENSSGLLKNSRLLDVYEKKMPDGGVKKSYALRLVFQSDDKTLSDEEIGGVMSKIGEEISKNPGWELR